MFGPTPLRDIFLVAGFELREMLRTRRALIVITLYMLGGLVAAYIFVDFLGRVEAAAAEALGTRAAATPGALTKQLLSEPTYREPIRHMFASPAVADFLLGLPPIAVFYALSSFMLAPILIMITSADTIAQERQSRGIRFVGFRTGRVEFVVGKTLGQGLLLGLVTLLAGASYMAVAAYGLQGFQFVPTFSAIFLFWPRVVVYAAPFLCLASLCSMNASSTNSARAFALISLVALWVVNKLAFVYRNEAVAPLLNFLSYLTPYAHQDDLWYPTYDTVGSAGAILLALCVLYLGIGLGAFRRRDL